MASKLTDNLNTGATPVEVGRFEIQRPFRSTGDTTALIVKRRYKQAGGSYTPATLGTADATYTSSYLVQEDDAISTPNNQASFSRTYASIPADVITYGSRVITKPTPSAVTGATSGASLIAYSDSALTLSYLFTNYLNYIFFNNQVYGAVKTTTSANSGGNTRVTFSAAHGIAGTEAIIAAGANGFSTRYAVFAAGTYSVFSSTVIDLTGVNYGANTISVGKYLRAYTPGTDRVRTKNTQSFYFPGITPGIATPEDITIPDPLLNDADFMAAILANTSGFLTYDATELTRWNGWPIYTQTAIAIDMANV